MYNRLVVSINKQVGSDLQNPIAEELNIKLKCKKGQANERKI